MAYGLPYRGQLDWDDELNNSVEDLKAKAEAAERNAESAQSNANYAKGRVDALAALTTTGITTPLVEDPADEGTYMIISQAFVIEDPSDPGTYQIGAPA